MRTRCLKVGNGLRWIFFVGVVAAGIALFGQSVPTIQAWEDAAKNIKRLSPSAVRVLPPEIVRSLQASGCLIPQPDPSFFGGLPPPYNVIHGEFAQKGQEDWAVLCSRQVEKKPVIEWHRTSKDSGETIVHSGKVWKSTVLFFWSKPTSCPSQLDLEMEDQGGLEDLGNGHVGYSLVIEPVKEEQLREMANPPPPGVMQHDGLALCGLKIGEAYYCQDRRWLEIASGD
jgi:hypothetical protein